MTDFLNSKHLIILIIVCAIIPQNSHQQEQVSKGNVVEAYCMFSYDSQNRYNCYLFNFRSVDLYDVVEFTGSHMPNHTDADVHGVLYIDSMITQFNGEVFKKFVNLRKIGLGGAQGVTWMLSINPRAFYDCGQLEELDFGGIGVRTTLPPRMLANCRHLRVFWADNALIRTLPEDLFGNTRSLEDFSFSNSRLMSIPVNLLSNMRNLRRFDISMNDIFNINPTILKNNLNLEEIDLSRNGLLEDTQEVMDLLDGRYKLRKILINHTILKMFDFKFLKQFKYLEELGIGGWTRLIDIQWDLLPGTLKVLKIYSIHEDIPEDAFVGLSNLTDLDIGQSDYTSLHPNTFSPLVNLERLDISYTRLATLHPQQFTSQLNLRSLRLDFNEIEELPEGIFAPFINLGLNTDEFDGLFMTGNRLRRLSINSFGQHPYLNYIFFRENQIYAIQRGLFSRFSQQPAWVDVTRNDCVATRNVFIEEENLDENVLLESCFNNYEGITTTTAGDD